MKKRIFSIGLCFMAIGIWPLFSNPLRMDGRLVLSDLIAEALKHNPLTQSAYAEWQASIQRIAQVKGFPDPILSYARFGQSVETRLGPQTDKISVSQRIPFFGKLSLAGKVAERHSAIQEAVYEKVAADIILGVKEAFFSLYWFEKILAIREEEKEVLKRLSRIALKKYEAGQSGQQDILKAQVEISRVTERILALEQGKRAIGAKLNALLNRSTDSHIGKIGTVDIPRIHFGTQELTEWAKEGRPELKQAVHSIAKNEESLKLAKKNNLPDFNIMVDYIFIGKGTTTHPEDGRNAWMGAVGINIPLWRGKYKAAEAEAAVKINASRKRYEDIRNDTNARIKELYLEIKTYEDQISLYRHSLVPLAEQSLKAAEAGYIAGSADFLNLLESERMILQVKTGLYKTLSDFRKTLARLERLVGQDFMEPDGIRNESRRPLGFKTGEADIFCVTEHKSKRQSEPVEGGVK